ncbi:MAG: hypothetical protein CMK09_09470 [Ponticaulis sp.]|nr:hypothetical protein [Ponticaulis sp.]|tara:strand:+ start:61105 stop:62106 length:1002 start_codon:yes stop_codon:yes gene_type:complete
MSLTSIRDSYHEVFQTLRKVAEREDATADRAKPREIYGAKLSDKPAFEVSLSAEASQKTEKSEVPDVDPRVEALSREKGRARERLIELGKQIKLVRKIWQYQPKELAKQLIRLAQELKDVLTDYKKAQKELAELRGSMSSGGAGMAMPNVSIPSATPPSAETSEDGETPSPDDMQKDAEQAVEFAEAELAHLPDETEDEVASVPVPAEEPDERVPDTDETSLKGLTAYGPMKIERFRLDQTPEAFELRGDLEFVNGAKSLLKELKDAFGDVKRWAIGFDQDGKDDRKLYELTGKVLKKLEKDLTDYEVELREMMPPAIWVSRAVPAGLSVNNG